MNFVVTLGLRTPHRKASLPRPSFIFPAALWDVGGKLSPSLGLRCKGCGKAQVRREVRKYPHKQSPLPGHSGASGAYLVKEAKNKGSKDTQMCVVGAIGQEEIIRQ